MLTDGLSDRWMVGVVLLAVEVCALVANGLDKIRRIP
jgi:hypothetical protein